jgi:hypothetical protein
MCFLGFLNRVELSLFFLVVFFPVDLLGTSVRAADVVSACFLYPCPCFVPLNTCARSVRSPSLDFALLNNMSERSCCKLPCCWILYFKVGIS